MCMAAKGTDSHSGTSENGHHFLMKTVDVKEEWVAWSSGIATGQYRCDSGCDLNEDDHCVIAGPFGHKIRIRTLRMTGAIFGTSYSYLPRAGSLPLPHTSLKRLGEVKNACCWIIKKQTP